MQFTFENPVTGEKPVDIALPSLLGNPPRTTMTDSTVPSSFSEPLYSSNMNTRIP
jgi:phosphoribosylformylglycinamidine synthase